VTDVYSGLQAQPELCLRAATENLVRLNHRIKEVRQRVRLAQLSAANSIERTAATQDRIAKSYWRLLEYSSDDVDAASCRHHADLHSGFAQDDRRIAERLRMMAER
jgi:hypothetical protein